MSPKIRYLHSSAVRALSDNASENPEHYEGPNLVDWREECSLPSGQWYIDSRENPLPSSDELQSCLQDTDYGPASDAQDSLALHSVLQMITPQQAADHRLWVGLAHFELNGYVRNRWPPRKLKPIPDPTKIKNQQVSHVRTHWFVRGARGLVRDNGVSRLWWMGRILKQIAKEAELDPDEVGQTLLERTDVRAQLIERPATASNIRLAAEITKLIRSDKQLIQRARFRRWMIALNQLGGIILLDALRLDELRRVVHEQANLALRT